MKKLMLVMLVLGLAESSLADVGVPKSDAIISIRDGKEHTFDPKDWMVVPRKAKKKPVAKAPVAERSSVSVVEKEVRVSQKNHLRLLGGVGPTGTGLILVPGLATLTTNYNPVFALAYGRNWSERWSVEGEVMTNASFLIGLGYNW